MTTWRLRVRDTSPDPYDVLVEADPAAPVGDLVGALEARGRTGGAVRVNGRPVDAGSSLGEVGLVHGDVVELGVASHEEPVREPGRFVVAVSGPEAGSWWRLPPGGRLVAGRGAQADVVLPDDLVSTEHLAITDGPDGTLVEDLGSTNGSQLEGEPLQGPARLDPGVYVQVGATVLTVLEVTADDLPHEAAARDGVRAFDRHPRLRQGDLRPPKAPEAPKHRDLDRNRPVWFSLLSLAGMAGFVVLTGRWIFLPFIALPAVATFVWTYRRRKQDEAEQLAAQTAYDEATAAHDTSVAALLAEERSRRRRAAVVGGESVLFAELRQRRLWERIAADDDHLEVCLGLASRPSTLEGLEDRQLWAVPLSVSLPASGSMLVQGDMARARAVGRSLLLNLAVTHAPTEVGIVVVTGPDRRRDWDWVRWLPHAYLGDAASAVHVTDDQRDAVLVDLVRTITAREGGAGGRPLVVLVDGAARVDAGRLTQLLTRGAEHGVFGIVLDDRVVPEGVHGTLRLGDDPDMGSFASRSMARVDGILTAELAVEWAERAARAIAGLRPTSDDARGEATQVRLTDLLGLQQPDGEAVRRLWSGAPREDVVVGLAGQTKVRLDIVGDGPHAIVGGQTRMGKTELLFTWITSMCLANPPEDLAFVIADFKAGVDHTRTAQFPHVLSLQVKEDLPGFERTLLLLGSEIRRRAELFKRVNASNLPGYRTAAAADTSLPAMPRLIVLVDEFSELKKVDRGGGGSYLAELESLARTGAAFGVHLVLVTQNFDAELSGQLEGQIGLGVCLRVKQPSHSKAVIGSDDAAHLPRIPGRALAHRNGQDLQLFQAARVAARRADLEAADATVRVVPVDFETLPVAAVRSGGKEVPHEQSDLAVLIDAVTEAADGARPPMPWPDRPDATVTMADVQRAAATAGHAGPAHGLLDRPEEQQVIPVGLAADDEVALVLASSPHTTTELLRVIVTADALADDPGTRQVEVIDLEGAGLQGCSALPHVGTVAGREALAQRLVRRLTEEVGRRRAAFERAGVTDHAGYVAHVGAMPTIRLVVNGAHRLYGSRSGEASPLLAPLAALVEDAAGTGLSIVLAGDSRLVAKNEARRATRRYVARFDDPAQYAGCGVPPNERALLGPEGRVWDLTAAGFVQFPTDIDEDTVVALGAALEARHAGVVGPEPLAEVRWPLPWSRLDVDRLEVPAGYGHAIPFGIDTETARWRWVDVDEDGPWVAVGGEGRSGRSAALVTTARLAAGLGWDVRVVAPSRRSPVARLADEGFHVTASIGEHGPSNGHPTLLLVDDVNRLDEERALADAIDAAEGPFLAVVAGPAGGFGRRTGAIKGVGEPRVAVTLAPRGSTDVTGTSIPAHLRGAGKAGRGVRVDAGAVSGVAFPLLDDV